MDVIIFNHLELFQQVTSSVLLELMSDAFNALVFFVPNPVHHTSNNINEKQNDFWIDELSIEENRVEVLKTIHLENHQRNVFRITYLDDG